MSVILFLLWIILNGRITVEILAFGVVITGAVFLFLVKVLGYSVSAEGKILKSLPMIILYVLNLIVELFKAAIQVLMIAFSPSGKPEPVLIEMHSGLKSHFLNVVLANSITLTPGTYTVFLEGDRLVIHCLRKEFANGMGDSTFIHLLRRFE